MSFADSIFNGSIYWLIFIWLICAVWLESSKYFSKYKRLFSLISAIILFTFIGARWETGTDWDNYKFLFDSLKLDWGFITSIYHFDIGYILLNAGVKIFTDSYTVFLFVDSFCAISLIYFLLQKTAKHPNISWLLFYTNFMLIQFMGSNRRMISMVLILWMIYFLCKKYITKSLISLSIAFLFHRSSIINLILYLVPSNAFSAKTIIKSFSICFIIGILQLPEKFIQFIAGLLSFALHVPLVELLTFYSENGEEHLVNATGSLFLSTILALGKRIIFLIFYWRLISRNKKDIIANTFFNVYILGIAGYLTLIGSFFQIITSFWALAEIILIGRIYGQARKNEKLIFCIFIIGFGILQIMNALNVYPELYIPYKSFLCQ